MTRRWAFGTAGLAAGFSGLAVVYSILTGVALAVAEAALVVVPLAITIVIARRVPRQIAREVWRVARAGLVAGFTATLVYDITRTALSILDPSPYNALEAIRRFGVGMMPAGTGAPMVMAAGLFIHFLNGSSFGMIYAIFAGRHLRTRRAAAVSGLAWGLTLELVQSILYPGWLQITTVLREFLVISGIGHVMYGLALGLGTWWLFPRGLPSEGPTEGPSLGTTKRPG
jgi:hypothetical protein